MSVWQKHCRYLGIIILFLAILFFVSAKEISVNLPSEVKGGEEFEVEITLVDFSEGMYDLKVDILGEGERVGKIFDEETGKYKSSYYFVKNVFSDGKANAKMKIESYEGKAEIEIKIRDEKGKSESFRGYEIEIKGIVEKDENKIGEAESENKIALNSGEENKTQELVEDEIESSIKNKAAEKVIYLSYNSSPQDIKIENKKDKSGEKTIFASNEEKLKKYVMIAFSVFAVFVIVMMMKKKI